MDGMPDRPSADIAARATALRPLEGIVESVQRAPDRSVQVLRAIRKDASRRLKPLDGKGVLELAVALLTPRRDVPRWFVYEMVYHHPPAMESLTAARLADLGRGMGSWDEVDPFACYLSGVAWREGRIRDEEIGGWARSPDRWWRRAAVVSTVPLNLKSRGGRGDADRTLAMCDRLKADRDDMVVKAVSWALRALAVREPQRVRAYLEMSGAELAPRVRREVSNKLTTGLKTPPSKG